MEDVVDGHGGGKVEAEGHRVDDGGDGEGSDEARHQLVGVVSKLEFDVFGG